ncbi:MAG: DUF3574 domain-containing protein [Kiritimatiellaeota bacterium]|nr:DUF3574 domain-containing protein [Kiritimatiellota bacterium]
MRCIKTELYFGEDESGGKHVGPKAWRAFLSEIVTPRFPKGMTVIEAYGQMQHHSGRIERQATRIIVLVHKPTPVAGQQICEIIEAYRIRFENAQVMRLRMPVLADFFTD